MLPTGKNYHAFISYSQKDKHYVSVIQKSIETLGLPFYKHWKPNVEIYRDERKTPLAGSLSDAIKKGLEESEHLIVFASKNSADSRWVKEEILYWHKLNHNKEGFITNFNFILIDDIIEWDYNKQNFDSLRTNAFPKLEIKLFKDAPVWGNLQQYCTNSLVQKSNSNYQWEIAKVKGLLLVISPDKIIDEVSKGRRIFGMVVGLVILSLLILTGFAFNERNKAIQNLKAFKKEEFDRNLKEGNTYLEAGLYCFAKKCFLKADSISNEDSFDRDRNQSLLKDVTHIINIHKLKTLDCDKE